MKYENKLKLRVILLAILSILGAAALATGIYLRTTMGRNDYGAGYLTGTGGGLIVVGLVLIFKNAVALKNKARQKSMRIAEEDERNLFLAYQAGYYTILAAFIGLYLATFYLALTGLPALKIVTPIMEGMLMLFCVTFFVLKKVK